MTELGISALGAVQLLLGGVLLLAPGAALADRLLGSKGLVWAPVFSLSALPLAAIVLDQVLGVPVHAVTTALLALAIALWAGRPRVAQWARLRERRATQSDRTSRDPAPSQPTGRAGATRTRLRRLLPLAFVLGFVALVHALPHLPGDASPWLVPDLAARAADGITGDDYPYPIHVDEHSHLAVMGDIERARTIDVGDPYTDAPAATGLFTVQGFRQERGFDLAIVQISHLTGMATLAIARFLPALWGAYLAACLYTSLRPAPGALASAALVAVLPTTAHFLGVGYLIPSTFALPWIAATLAVATRGRVAGLILLITAAHFLHLVIGVLCLLTALLATAMRPGTPAERGTAAAGILLPLVWIVPAAYEDLVAAVTDETILPFETSIFLRPGLVFYALAAAGVGLAFYQRRLAHKAWATLALITLALMAWSVQAGHASDATYTRLVHAFLLALAAGAGLVIGQVPRLRPRWRMVPRPAAVAAMLTVTALAVGPGVHANLEETHYRIWDDASWHRAQAYEAVARQDDVFLTDPWQAPLVVAMTGATPHAVLRPGSPPVGAADFQHYVDSGGADAAWLHARGITVVLFPIAPNAPHERAAEGVFLLGDRLAQESTDQDALGNALSIP